MTTGSKMEAALQLARKGFSVFPLNSALPTRDGRFFCSCGSLHVSDKNSPAKHPMARLAPRGLTDASTDEVKIREWWFAAPSANIGLVTGKVVVLDVDPGHGGNESLQAFEERNGPLPLTWRVVTGGGGEHIYFRAPNSEIRNSTSKIAPGLDIRGSGGYVVAPPSLHISGRTYEWSVEHHPDHIALAEFPDSLRDSAPAGRDKIAASVPSEWRSIIAEPLAEGSRNHTLARLAGHLLRRYVDPHVVLEICRLWNMARCCPPLPADEVILTVNSICRRELARRKAAV